MNKGKSFFTGEQVIPEQWILDSVTPDAPHLMPGEHPWHDNKVKLGYGYQWWIPERNVRDKTDYLAIGVYNQFIYINPTSHIVIAKNSAYSKYGEDAAISELKAIAAFRAITDAN